MNVFLKKLNKHKSDVLQSGEEFRAAINLQRSGGSATQVGAAAGGLVGSLIGAAVDKKDAAKQAEKEGAEGRPWAAEFPKWGVIAGLTDRRLMFWAASSGAGKPTDLILEKNLDEVSLETEEQKTKLLRGKPKATEMIFRFNDGTVFRGSAIKMGPGGKAVDQFAAELGGTSGA